MYIRQSSTSNRLGSFEGTGYRSFGETPEQADARAQNFEAQALQKRSDAAAVKDSPLANQKRTELINAALSLEAQARSARASAASEQRKLDQAAAADRERSQAIIGMSTNLLNVGANVGTAFMQADMARKAARDAARAGAGAPAPVTYVTQGGGGLGTGAIVAIVGGLAAVVVLVVVMSKK
jgi:hypothetical protein